MVPGVMEALVGWLSGKARGGILLRRWGMAVTRSPLGQLVYLVDVAAPGLLEPLGQERDPADRGEPPDRRPGWVGIGDRALVAPELLGVPLQLDPHGLAVREVQPAVREATRAPEPCQRDRMARSDSQVASG